MRARVLAEALPGVELYGFTPDAGLPRGFPAGDGPVRRVEPLAETGPEKQPQQTTAQQGEAEFGGGYVQHLVDLFRAAPVQKQDTEEVDGDHRRAAEDTQPDAVHLGDHQQTEEPEQEHAPDTRILRQVGDHRTV